MFGSLLLLVFLRRIQTVPLAAAKKGQTQQSQEAQPVSIRIIGQTYAEFGLGTPGCRR